MAGKEIKFGVEGRAAMLKGVETLADAVQVGFSQRFAREDSVHRKICYCVLRQGWNFCIENPIERIFVVVNFRRISLSMALVCLLLFLPSR